MICISALFLAYTPAWQEIFTGIDSKTLLQFAHEWADTANITEGKCMILVGAGINYWYHQNLMYRAGAMALMVCGALCPGLQFLS